MKKKITIGVTAASGSIYAKLLLQRISAFGDQVESCSIVFSEHAAAVWKYELREDLPKSLDSTFPVKVYSPGNFFAPIASGSSAGDAMIICPCTVGTMGRIAAGTASDLMTRAADVMLKERRRLILVLRETPYSLIHINNMKLLTEAGAVICPATPSFYSRPSTIEAVVMTVVDRALTLAGIDVKGYRWGAQEESQS